MRLLILTLLLFCSSLSFAGRKSNLFSDGDSIIIGRANLSVIYDSVEQLFCKEFEQLENFEAHTKEIYDQERKFFSGSGCFLGNRSQEEEDRVVDYQMQKINKLTQELDSLNNLQDTKYLKLYGDINELVSSARLDLASNKIYIVDDRTLLFGSTETDLTAVLWEQIKKNHQRD